MALLSGDLLTAEGILLQNGLVEEAIRINIEVYNWNRCFFVSSHLNVKAIYRLLILLFVAQSIGIGNQAQKATG